MYETWNDIAYNQLTFHTGPDSEHGQCIVDGKNQSASVVSGICDNSQNDPPKQFAGQGCASAGSKGSAGSSDGGICKSPP